VAELTGSVELSGRPEGTRPIVRRERPHPGAERSFSDVDGHRFTCFLTDPPDADIGALELRHRRRARVENRIRCAENTTISKPALPCLRPRGLARACAVAQDLFAWAGRLILDGELGLAEPKRLRHRLLHMAGRLVRSGRRTKLRVARDWPWAERSWPPSSAYARCRSARPADRRSLPRPHGRPPSAARTVTGHSLSHPRTCRSTSQRAESAAAVIAARRPSCQLTALYPTAIHPST
jgi:hypothetical protein